MKILLYLLLVLQIISSAILFFYFITTTAWYLAIIYLFIALLQATLTIVVIDNKNRIANLESNLDYVFYKLKKLENTNDDLFEEKEFVAPAVENRQEAAGTWECISCGTINKIGTTHCANCQTNYSPTINPTVYPGDKKKRISRWIKYK